MDKSRLILGTAEFNPIGYSDILPVSGTEIVRILHCAKEGGINIIDTAESYNCYNILKTFAKGFCIYNKTRDWKVNLNWGDNELRGLLYHYGNEEKVIDFPFIHRWVNLGASVYNKSQIPESTRIIQIPFNIENTEFINCFNTHRTIFVRSVFKRGKLLKKYSIKECLHFASEYRPDGIIVGVKSVKELEEILKVY